MGLAPEVRGEETTGICELCEVRQSVESALAHALVALRAATEEVERERCRIWPPGSPLAEP